jgi:hypothetical protein
MTDVAILAAEAPETPLSPVTYSDQAAAEAFRTLLYGNPSMTMVSRWRGESEPHPLRCHAGHLADARPVELRRVVKLNCPACERSWIGQGDAEAMRVRTVAAHKGWRFTHGETWKGPDAVYAAECANGHRARVNAGSEPCRRNACGRQRAAFYVVSNPDTKLTKLGVTGFDYRPRLDDHHRAGLTHVNMLIVTPAGGINAFDIERATLRTLKTEFLIDSVPGKREYFDLSRNLIDGIEFIADDYRPGLGVYAWQPADAEHDQAVSDYQTRQLVRSERVLSAGEWSRVQFDRWSGASEQEIANRYLIRTAESGCMPDRGALAAAELADRRKSYEGKDKAAGYLANAGLTPADLLDLAERMKQL